MKNNHEIELDITKEASKKGAVEDILHVSQYDEGFDLRYSGAIGKKQKLDENGNA